MPLNPRIAAGLRRDEVDRLRSHARRVPRRVRLRHPAAAQGPEAAARSGRWSSASTGWKAARGRASTPRRGRRTTTVRAASSPSGATSSTARRTRTIGENTFRQIQRKANPLKLSAVQLHHPPAPADARLARNAAERRSEADRVLRPELRRQDGDARAGRREAVLPVHLLRRLQRVDRQERERRSRPQLHVDRRVRDVRVRPGAHVQLRRDGVPDRPAAVHGRTRARRRRRHRRHGGAASSRRCATCTRTG